MKKILLLGGSNGQLPAIYEANRRGYYTILCDYLPDNPCRKFANEYYEISTTDKEAVLSLARQLNIDFIYSYASDPAAPTSAYVSDALKLYGSSYESVRLLSEKDLFRSFLQHKGFNVPSFIVVDQDLKIEQVQHLSLPLIVKPVDSSDTKGVNLINDMHKVDDAVKKALEFSRKKKVIIEEFVDASLANLHGDAFFQDGNMIFCMLGDRIYSSDSNPLKPSTELYPSRASVDIISRVEDTVRKIIQASGFQFGAINIEVRVDQKEDIYVMEIGPRSGGTLTPDAIAHSTGFDMLRATFDCFEFGKTTIDDVKNKPAICFALHANAPGIFEALQYAPHLTNYVVEEHIYVKKGDAIKPFSEPGSTIGVLILTFNDMEDAEKVIKSLYTDVQLGIKINKTESLLIQ
ncbi:MAG: ATP-grasp domain-containing protein [Balneolales bacterium]